MSDRLAYCDNCRQHTHQDLFKTPNPQPSTCKPLPARWVCPCSNVMWEPEIEESA